jgi:hypothetical protein
MATEPIAPAGHAAAPCMLYNPRYDFNNALIPLDSSMWVRRAEGWLNVASPASPQSGWWPTSAQGHHCFPGVSSGDTLSPCRLGPVSFPLKTYAPLSDY